ncbi:MAG: tyrosine-type recombinase/integrase [Nitrospirota bacterium]|nr:tyrosine-type recombinase/integrase [Nitrospirota bacterium]
MARLGRKDRGLVSRLNATGKAQWYVRLIADGRDRRFGAFQNKTEARDFYEKAKQEQQHGRFFPERYQHGGHPFVEALLTRHAETTTVKGKATEQFYMRWWMARLKGLRLHHVTPSVIEDAQRDLLAKQYAPQTVVHYLKALRHVLNKAVRDGKLDRNPFARVQLVKVKNGKTRFLTPEEETRLLEKLGPIYGPWARLAVLTGLRLGEQFKLRWADVDLDRGLIVLPETKAGIVQYVRLNEEAREILRTRQIQQMNRNVASPFVYPSDTLATPLDQRNFYARTFHPVVVALKLDGVGWHTLRHTFASRLAMSGQTEGTIATLLRHSTNTLVRRYAHLSPSHLHAAVETVAAFGKDAPKPEISNGTVTVTVMREKASEAIDRQVVENIGAGDGI